MLKRNLAIAAAVTTLLACASAQAAPTDEIQVYTGEIMPVGRVGLTWHGNYTLAGLRAPDFPGAQIDDHAFASVTEWALGVTPWFEAGLYLPLYSHSQTQGWNFDGFKLRALFVQPDNGEKDFYYGVNFEFSWNQPSWDAQTNTSEMRPIIGWRFGEDRRWSLTFNPILDTNFKGGIGGLEFVPSTRLDYALNKTWTVGLEEYDDFGQLSSFLPGRDQFHEIWLAADYTGDPVSIEFGVGAGLTPASDALTAKLMFMTDLSGPHSLFAR